MPRDWSVDGPRLAGALVLAVDVKIQVELAFFLSPPGAGGKVDFRFSMKSEPLAAASG